MKRKLSAWACALGLAAASGPAAAACKLQKAVLPVTMVGSRPTIETTLDGKPVRLEVDSGAFYSLLSPASAAQLNLKLYAAPFGLRVEGVGGDTAVSATRVEFGISKSKIPRVEFLVGGGSLQAEMGVVGVMGRNILRVLDDEFDFAHGEMALIKPDGCGSQTMIYWPFDKNASVLGMDYTNDERDTSMKIDVKVNGATLHALMDTGAGDSVLTLDGARKAGLDVNGRGAVHAEAGGGIGRRRVASWIVPVASVDIGGEEIQHTKVRVGDYTLPNADMLLGADFFLSHHVYVAWGQRRVYFTYNGGPVFDLSVKPEAEQPPLTAAMTSAPRVAPTAPTPPQAGDPKDADGYSRRGQAYLARRDYARALADLSHAVELEPENPRYLRERAQVRLFMGQPFLAMTDLDALLKAAPDDGEGRVLRASLRVAGHDSAGAQADLDAADKALPPQADLRLSMASLFTGLKRYDRAVAQTDLWLASHDYDNRKPAALNERCWARALAGRDLDKALADCDAAVRLEPRMAAYLDSRGLVRLKRGELDRAVADYDAALKLDPKLALSLYVRGVAKTRRGDAAAGQADIASATALDPGIPIRAREAGVAP